MIAQVAFFTIVAIIGFGQLYRKLDEQNEILNEILTELKVTEAQRSARKG